MAFAIILALLFGGAVVYFFLNPTERIEKTELRELETLDAGYGASIEKFLAEGEFNAVVTERYFYLKHKYNLTKQKAK